MSTTLKIGYLRLLTRMGKKSLITTSVFSFPYRISLGDAFSENPFYNPYSNVGEILATAAWVLDKQNPVIFDIGGHCGFIATQLAQMLKKNDPVIYSFEPVAPTFSDLLHSVNDLSLQKYINPVAVALSDSSGFVQLSYSKWSSMLAQIIPEGKQLNARAGSEIYIAASQTLDDFVKISNLPDVIKIDVEGWETNVLRGAAFVERERADELQTESEHRGRLFRRANDFARRQGHVPNARAERDLGLPASRRYCPSATTLGLGRLAIAPRRGLPSERIERGPDVRGAHQRFAHEHRLNAGRFQQRHVGIRADPALADDRHARGDAGPQFEGLLQSRDESAQIAVVDADDRGTRIEDAREMLRIVEFHEDIQPHSDGFAVQPREFVTRQDFGDEQDGVGPGDAGFEQLIAFEDEFLPQDRDADRRANRAEVVEMPLEISFIGEDAERSRAVALVDAGDLHRVEVSSDNTGRGGGLLHLGDHGQFAGDPESFGEAPARRQVRDSSFE